MKVYRITTQKISWLRIISLSCLLMCGVTMYSQSYQQLADSLIRKLPLLASDTQKCYTYRDISYYLLFSNPDSALIFSLKGETLARNLQFVPGQIWNLNQQGYALEIMHAFDSALHCYEKAVSLARQINDRHAEARMINVIGTLYYQQGNFSTAIAYYDQAMQRFESLDDAEGQSQTLNNMGIIYRIRRNYARAIHIYKQSLALKQQLDDAIGAAHTMRNLGLLHAYKGDAEMSLDYLHAAIDILEQHDKPSEIAACEVGIGHALYTLGQYDEASFMFEKALDVLPQTYTLEYLTATLLLGSLQVQQAEVAAGFEKMQQAYEHIRSSGRLDLLRKAEKEMAQAAARINQTALAAKHWKNYALLSDSLASEQQQWAMEEMMAKFDTREKENMIRLQSLALAEESAKNKLYLMIGLLFVLVSAGSTAYAYKRVRVNRRLRLAQTETQAALDEKEMLFKEMHHRVKNNLQMLSSLLSLQMNEIQDEATLGVVTSNRNRLHSISLIHQLLYTNDDFRKIDMQQFINNLIQHCRQVHDLKTRNIQLETRLEKLWLDIDAAIPTGLIINELLTNAIKHAFPGGKQGTIRITLGQNDGKIKFTISDDGVGFKSGISSKDTFGHKLIKTLAKKMKADMQANSDKGTEVRIQFEATSIH